MSSKDLKILQRDAFAAIQQLKMQSSSMASLQMQLAQRQLYGDSTESTNGVAAPPAEQYLVFSLSNHDFAVKAELVQGVERLIDLTLVPNVAPWVRGVINLHGSIVSVVDLRLFLELEQLAYTPRTRLLSLQHNEMVIGFVVDGVSEMLSIPTSALVNGKSLQAAIPQWAIPYAAGGALLANRAVVILDVARLLFSEKMQRYEAQ